MKISGKPIAESIISTIQHTISEKNLKPHLVIINAGSDPNSQAYIKHKKTAAEKAGIQFTEYIFSESEEKKCLQTIEKLNNDSSVHGIIAQLPLHDGWDREMFIQTISDSKDVDGFKENSPFFGATACGVWEMLEAFAKEEHFSSTEAFLKGKKLTVVGKGITAGKPTVKLLTEKGFPPTVIDSKTTNADEILRNSDVIVSASGKKHIIHEGNIKEGSYIIGIGVGREMVNGEQKVFGDINPDIESKAKLYCPTIGGIGPLTIACLLRNVLEAAEKTRQ
jgi:methylenetetrahydrofolate dehydrogenase (NADP+)/methenyltetrahydrofolate cyclohydrolase